MRFNCTGLATLPNGNVGWKESEKLITLILTRGFCSFSLFSFSLPPLLSLFLSLSLSTLYTYFPIPLDFYHSLQLPIKAVQEGPDRMEKAQGNRRSPPPTLQGYPQGGQDRIWFQQEGASPSPETSILPSFFVIYSSLCSSHLIFYFGTEILLSFLYFLYILSVLTSL